MATSTIHLTASPQQVWDVISDPGTYPRWLIGAKRIRSIDEDWPAVGSAFHHVIGVGPMVVKDATSVLEQRPPERLVLHARVGPGGMNRVVFTLAPGAHGGTDLTMQEYPARGPLVRLAAPLLDLVTLGRNEISIRRLRGLLRR